MRWLAEVRSVGMERERPRPPQARLPRPGPPGRPRSLPTHTGSPTRATGRSRLSTTSCRGVTRCSGSRPAIRTPSRTCACCSACRCAFASSAPAWDDLGRAWVRAYSLDSAPAGTRALAEQSRLPAFSRAALRGHHSGRGSRPGGASVSPPRESLASVLCRKVQLIPFAERTHSFARTDGSSARRWRAGRCGVASGPEGVERLSARRRRRAPRGW